MPPDCCWNLNPWNRVFLTPFFAKDGRLEQVSCWLLIYNHKSSCNCLLYTKEQINHHTVSTMPIENWLVSSRNACIKSIQSKNTVKFGRDHLYQCNITTSLWLQSAFAHQIPNTEKSRCVANFSNKDWSGEMVAKVSDPKFVRK